MICFCSFFASQMSYTHSLSLILCVSVTLSLSLSACACRMLFFLSVSLALFLSLSLYLSRALCCSQKENTHSFTGTQKSFTHTHSFTRTHCTHTHTLTLSLLILPIQRIPRYKLLLNEIVKNTKPTHPDYTQLTTALSKVEAVSHEINDRMKEFERRETVKLIERSFKQNIKLLAPHRQFIKQGKLWKVCRNRDRIYNFFLFNDLILYASTYGSKYSLHNQLSIDQTFDCKWIENAGKYGEEKNGRIFQIITAKKSFVVYSETNKDGREWFDAIHKAQLEQQSKATAGATPSGHFKNESTSAAIWVPDTHKSNCSLCNDKFTFVNRRHHCRRCGELVCGKCSKFKLPNAEGVQQRACKKC